MHGSSRVIDRNGFLTIKACPISSFGIFDYSAGQIGLPGDPNRIVKVYRPESEVNHPDAIASFKNVPFIDNHEMLSGFEGDEDNTAPEEYGIDGVLTSEVYYAKPWLRGDLKVFSRKLRRAIDSGKVDLSLGYDCQFIIQSGTFDGQPYEVMQVELRGNHIALVDVGRVPGARVLDGRCFDHLCLSVRPSDEELSMYKGIQPKIAGKGMDKAARDNAIEQLRALIPALEQAMQEQGGASESEVTTEVEQPSGESVEVTHETEGNGEPAEVTVEPSAENSEPENSTSESEEQTSESTSGEADLSSLIARVNAVLTKLESGAPTGDESSVEIGDRTEGLQEEASSGGDLEKDDSPTKVEKASPGPKGGTNTMANDSAVRAVRSDIARADSIYKRLSKVTGAFDHSSMASRDVAKYGVKKLGLKCADGAEFDALDAYLSGLERGQSVQAQATVTKRAADSASSAELDAWLNGSAK